MLTNTKHFHIHTLTLLNILQTRSACFSNILQASLKEFDTRLHRPQSLAEALFEVATWLLLHRVSKSLFFTEKKSACGNVPTSQGLPKIWGPFLGEKKRLRQRTHKSGASKNMGALFSGKKAPAAMYPQVRGFQKYGGLFF